MFIMCTFGFRSLKKSKIDGYFRSLGALPSPAGHIGHSRTYTQITDLIFLQRRNFKCANFFSQNMTLYIFGYPPNISS